MKKNIIKLKKFIPENKMVPAKKVKPGMRGVDYGDNSGKVLRVGKLSDYKKFRRWDSSGWLDNDQSITDNTEITPDEFDQFNIVAADLDDYGVSVWIYGNEGFAVFEQNFKEIKIGNYKPGSTNYKILKILHDKKSVKKSDIMIAAFSKEEINKWKKNKAENPFTFGDGMLGLKKKGLVKQDPKKKGH